VGDIVIGEQFINDVITTLGAIAETIPDAQQGQWATTDIPMDLSAPVCRAGAAGFPHGVSLAKHVKDRGHDLNENLEKYNTTITQFKAGLRTLLDDTDKVESLNSMSANDFARYFDTGTGGTGGSGTGGSGTGGSGTGGSGSGTGGSGTGGSGTGTGGTGGSGAGKSG
jgi:hypothetical protein